MANELKYFKDIIDDNNNPDGWTPLLWAAREGNLETIQELVAQGADLTIPKTDGITLFHIAASSNDIHIIDYAIKLKHEN